MNDYSITKEDVLAATEGGKAVILYFYPQSAVGFSSRRNFSIRGHDDKKPSCTVFQKNGTWFIQDKGGTDTKAYTAITLVQRELNLKFPQALEWIAQQFAPDLLRDRSGRPAGRPEPTMKRMKAQDEITVQLRKSGKFTQAELDMLGYKITQEICDLFCLKPVDSYITRVNTKGDSWQIGATDEYPIYYYDYGSYGKLYQPLGELRFLWVGQKPEGLISGESEFLQRWEKASGTEINPFVVPADPDDEESEEQDLTWKELIICSGPSDALNVRRAGYHVCWLNSETADLTPHEYATLGKIAKKLYILYDIDDTGIKQMQKIALAFLDIAIIQLPADLSQLRTRKGGQCKDAKDFFVHYRRPELGSVDQIFDNMVKLAGGLKFWQEKLDKKRTLTGYDINNSQMYGFLQALGFYTIDDPGKTFTFCHVKDNRVEVIHPDEIKSRCMHELQNYLIQHPQYYRQALANSIFRSKQISKDSFANLRRIQPDFDAYTADADYFFFRNAIIKVTAAGIETVKPSECPYFVYSDKIIDHDFKAEQPFFSIDYTQEYADALALLARCAPRTPDYLSQKKQADAVKDTRRYRLEIHRPDFDWLQFVYNTGRVWWQEEEAGYKLTEDQAAEHDLNFIAKVAMLGYMLSKHKDAAKPYGVYAMETEQGDEGEHRGGTGKSILLGSVEQLRRQEYIDGRSLKSDKMEFILQKVKKGYTDTIYIDDLNSKIDLHYFMNWITGKMEVNAKYADKVTLSYADSPKVSFSSNHAITNFDGSMKRRTWFAAFSNYYHSEDPAQGLTHRSPDMEFHRTLIQDYGPEDMNHFYNFMFNCLIVWKKFRVRIQPSMRSLEQRNLKKAMTQEFLYWAEDYFTEDKLNQLHETKKVFDEYKTTLPKSLAEMMKTQTFKKRLQMFCQYKDWIFNPQCLMTSDTEKQRNDIRRKVLGEDRYYFFIDTTKSEDLPVGVILASVDQPDGGAGDAPGTGKQEPWENGPAAAAAAAPQSEADEKPLF